MENVKFRVPAARHHWEVDQFGNVIYDTQDASSSRFILRSQSGYVGKRPTTKPLPVHDYSFNQQDMNITHVAEYWYTNGFREYAVGPALSQFIAGAIFKPTYDWSSLYNATVAKLSDKVRGDLDVSVDLAEAGKTAKMFRVMDNVINYTKTFRKKWGLLKVPANAWLEYTYGVKPLLSTIYGVANENLRVVINKTAKFSARTTEVYRPKTCGVNTIFGMVDFPCIGDIKVSLTIGVDMRTEQFDLARWSSLNPVSIAWELMPYSFVVDWFYNVGGYLRNMETYLLYANKFRSGYKTTLAAGAVKLELNDYGGDHVSRWNGSCSFIDIQRVALASYPAPHLPSFKAALGSSRLLSGAALLAQHLGRR